MIPAYQLFTGPDGDSQVTRGYIPSATLVKAESILFMETPAHSSLDWHTAPTTQYVITLSGTLEFTLRNGDTFTVEPGNILVARDTTGTGHKWRLIDDQPWKRAYIVFPPGTDPQFLPL